MRFPFPPRIPPRLCLYYPYPPERNMLFSSLCEIIIHSLMPRSNSTSLTKPYQTYTNTTTSLLMVFTTCIITVSEHDYLAYLNVNPRGLGETPGGTFLGISHFNTTYCTTLYSINTWWSEPILTMTKVHNGGGGRKLKCQWNTSLANYNK